MSQDFLRQVLITSFLGAHEADHYSTARFQECDTWLKIVLSATVRMNMLSVWNFGRVSAVLFTTTRLCGELRPRVAKQIGHQSLNGRVSRCVPFSQHLWVGFKSTLHYCTFRFTRNIKLSGLDPHRRLLVDHQLKLLGPHVSRLHRCRRLPHPRHLSHSLQPSPTLCEAGFHSSE